MPSFLDCERLMGLPDDWTKYGADRDAEEYNEKIKDPFKYKPEVKEMSDTRRYKACGNGIVTNVVEEVVRRLYDSRIA